MDRFQSNNNNASVKNISSRVYNLSNMALQQELDPIRIFRASASAVLLDDWADSP